MRGAVEHGKETAVKFYEEHVAEVKKVVPQERLLVWEVRMSSSQYSYTVLLGGEGGLGPPV